MIMRWLACGGGNIHIIAPCPHCYTTQQGLLIGTTSSIHKGRVMAECLDCHKTIDYYVDAREKKIWKLQPVEARGAQLT